MEYMLGKIEVIKIKNISEKFKEVYNEGYNSINYIMQEIEVDNKNIFEEFDNDKLYIYSNNLTVSPEESINIWLDNEEKNEYYKEIFLNDADDINDVVTRLKDKLANINNELYVSSYNTYFREYALDLIKVSSKRVDSLVRHALERYAYMKKDYMNCKIGLLGEERVNNELSLFNNYINLKNVRLEVLDNNNVIQSIENDNILLTRNGIFVIEVKNLGEIGNYDIIIEKDGRWLKQNRCNREKTPLKNITSQNNRHIGYLNKFINSYLNRSFDNYIEVDGIIVIANEKVSIENHNDIQNIFRVSDIHGYIKKQPVKFKEDELLLIKKALEENNLPPKKYPIINYHFEVQNNINSLHTFVNKYEVLSNKIIDIIDTYEKELLILKELEEKELIRLKELEERELIRLKELEKRELIRLKKIEKRKERFETMFAVSIGIIITLGMMLAAGIYL